MAHMIFSDGEYKPIKRLSEKALAFKVKLHQEAEAQLAQEQNSLEKIARLIDGRVSQKQRKAAK